MNAILLMFHVGPATGYAIDSLMEAFVQMAARLVVDRKHVHIAFPSMAGLKRCDVLTDIGNLIEFTPRTRDREQLDFIREYIREQSIDMVFGFDQPVHQQAYRHMRRAGVRRIVSYQGAPMSSLNRGLRLWLKRLEVMLTPAAPDLYIFESRAMARTAYQGRGVPERQIEIVYLGVDENRYQPAVEMTSLAHDIFGIPKDRKIVYYSGHMEERKGVAVLMHAVRDLYDRHGRRDFHFLLLGNRDNEERQFLDMLEDTGAREHVTFGGYRKDVEQILPGCYLGVIASTGWDSFTMSSLEITSCGLPLLVSRLQGLVETIEEGTTGFTFTPGEHIELAAHIAMLIDDPIRRDRMGACARQRILSGYTRQQQIDHLVDVMKKIV